MGEDLFDRVDRSSCMSPIVQRPTLKEKDNEPSSTQGRSRRLFEGFELNGKVHKQATRPSFLTGMGWYNSLR
jgi:hypothetical protein